MSGTDAGRTRTAVEQRVLDAARDEALGFAEVYNRPETLHIWTSEHTTRRLTRAERAAVYRLLDIEVLSRSRNPSHFTRGLIEINRRPRSRRADDASSQPPPASSPMGQHP